MPQLPQRNRKPAPMPLVVEKCERQIVSVRDWGAIIRWSCVGLTLIIGALTAAFVAIYPLYHPSQADAAKPQRVERKLNPTERAEAAFLVLTTGETK